MNISRIAELISSAVYIYLIRPFLPSVGLAKYNNITVSVKRKRLDTYFAIGRRRYSDIPSYEETLIAALRDHIEYGQNVIIIGAGYGVTAVVAAQQAGINGTITCYEASKDAVRISSKTAALNGVLGQVSVKHVAVGEIKNPYGGGLTKSSILPARLPECDVLSMDCEGAELEILRCMNTKPKKIIVETHGVNQSSTADVNAQLLALGYVVHNWGPAEPRYLEECIKWDVNVLVGVRASDMDPK